MQIGVFRSCQKHSCHCVAVTAVFKMATDRLLCAKGRPLRRLGWISLRQDGKEDERGGESGKTFGLEPRRPSGVIPAAPILVLLGVWTLGGSVVAENTGKHLEMTGTPISQSSRPLDSWRCVELILHAAVIGSIYGLLMGAVTVAIVWLAQVASSSTGLVATVQRVPLMGLLIGAVLGALEGTGGIAELLGPGLFWGAVEGAVKGASTGVTVAGVGGVAINGAMCAVAVVPVRNMVRGGDLRVAPLVTVSAAMGAVRVALSLAPEAVAMGTFVGAVLGSTWDFIILKALGAMACARGGCYGVSGLEGGGVPMSVSGGGSGGVIWSHKYQCSLWPG
ncbi:hypothetical protein GN956_G2603 [Arapaima gigas]